MLLDLHVHCAERSACGRSGEEEMIESAIRFGLGGIFFTDHGRNAPPGRISELNDRYAPFKIFRGIEVSAGSEHVLVLGMESPELEKRDFWTYPALRRFVLRGGGFMILAHPYRYAPVGDEIFDNPPDAVELRSGNTDPGNEPLIADAARRMGCGTVCASDAHEAGNAGMHHVVLEEPARDEREVISALMSGEYICGADDSRVRKHLKQKNAAQPAGG